MSRHGARIQRQQATERAAPVGVEPKLPGVVFRRVVTHVVRSVGR